MKVAYLSCHGAAALPTFLAITVVVSVATMSPMIPLMIALIKVDLQCFKKPVTTAWNSALAYMHSMSGRRFGLPDDGASKLLYASTDALNIGR